jgi:Ca2+-binding RTX toxin-like protein
MTGCDGNDRIFNNSRDDIIHGGTGNDRSTGRQGADRFIFNVGEKRDRITDFDVTEDTLDFISFGFANEAAALAFATDVDASVEFDFAGQDNLTLERGCES